MRHLLEHVPGHVHWHVLKHVLVRHVLEHVLVHVSRHVPKHVPVRHMLEHVAQNRLHEPPSRHSLSTPVTVTIGLNLVLIINVEYCHAFI